MNFKAVVPWHLFCLVVVVCGAVLVLIEDFKAFTVETVVSAASIAQSWFLLPFVKDRCSGVLHRLWVHKVVDRLSIVEIQVSRAPRQIILLLIAYTDVLCLSCLQRSKLRFCDRSIVVVHFINKF